MKKHMFTAIFMAYCGFLSVSAAAFTNSCSANCINNFEIQIKETHIIILHSLDTKHIVVYTEHFEILYQRYNARDTETRIVTSMYPSGTYYISLDDEIVAVEW